MHYLKFRQFCSRETSIGFFFIQFFIAPENEYRCRFRFAVNRNAAINSRKVFLDIGTNFMFHLIAKLLRFYIRIYQKKKNKYIPVDQLENLNT